jgi:hypothetical protein
LVWSVGGGAVTRVPCLGSGTPDMAKRPERYEEQQMKNRYGLALGMGIILEAIAFSFLLCGKWEFLGEVDLLGTIGIVLHYPGFEAARLLHVPGNASWLVIVGIPLLCWVCVALIGIKVKDFLIRK